MNQNDYLETEEESLRDLKLDLENLKSKWFKTKSSLDLIKFLEQYLELKKKLIEDIKNLK